MISDVIDKAAVDAVACVLQYKASYRIVREVGFIIVISLLTIIYTCCVYRRSKYKKLYTDIDVLASVIKRLHTLFWGGGVSIFPDRRKQKNVIFTVVTVLD